MGGAKFGWQLALLILVVNLLKYPFFRAGVSYTISTKQTLQQGYLGMGRRYLAIALGLNTIASVVNAAALLLFAASLLSYFIPFNIAKGIMGVLVVATVAVFVVALSNYSASPAPDV